MARNAFDWLALFVEREALSTQCYSLIDLDMTANDAGGADYYPCTVVDGEIIANLSGRMDVDARFAMRHLGDDAWNQRHPQL